MKQLICFTLFLLCVVLVSTTSDSDPSQIYLCDATSSLWGCDPAFWINNNRLQCANKSKQIMSWASKPVRSNCYRVVAGEEDAPATTYTPDEILYIHVRTTCFDKNYRGILLYAVDENEMKVGDWVLPDDAPAWFERPWSADPTHSCYRSVMHASASIKPYHSVFRFKTPPTGTGRITFRCLIKWGNANTGAFYWPNAAGDLSLTEAPNRTSIWYKSDVSQSCTEYCKTLNQVCDPNQLQMINSPKTFHKNISPLHVCKLPYLSGCASQGATYDPADEFCYYIDPQCTAQNRTQSSVTCDSKITDSAKFCPCVDKIIPTSDSAASSGTVGTDSNTSGTDDTIDDPDEEMSGASSLVLNRLAFLVAVPFLMGYNEKSVLLSALLMSGMASAHNWVNTISRSVGASAYAPCKPPITELPHYQVGPNQAFQIEWMNGHGSFAYFAILHSKNVDKMRTHTIAMFEDYIKNAPNGSNVAQQPKFQKYHRKDNMTLDNNVPVNAGKNSTPNFFQSFIWPNNSLYIYRPPSQGGRIGNVGSPNNNSKVYQVSYKPTELSKDVRVSYQSSKYPWIEAIYKFQVVTYHPVEPDTANFYIPGFGGPGRYIVQYWWAGYYDCIDVDYKSAPVSDVYGFVPNGTRFTRIDHCLFENIQSVFDAAEILTDAKYCLERCAANQNCLGVNLVPLQAPKTAYQMFAKDPNWQFPNIYGTDIYVPWNNTRFNLTKNQFLKDPSPEKYMCYTLLPAIATDTMDDFSVTNDPEDPIFYSTCFYKLRTNMFDDYVNKTGPTLVEIPWRYNDKCVDCQSVSRNAYSDVLPKWTVTDTCVNCDKEPIAPARPTPIETNLVETGVRCDGYANSFSRAAHHNCSNITNACWRTLIPLGRPSTYPISIEECHLMVKREPSCSNYYMWRHNTSVVCSCYTNNPCCKTCSRRPDATFNIYEVNTTPDPTCANGVLSTDNLSCCSAGCANCTANAAVVDSVGFCCSTCVTRPCSKYGPPCKII